MDLDLKLDTDAYILIGNTDKYEIHQFAGVDAIALCEIAEQMRETKGEDWKWLLFNEFHNNKGTFGSAFRSRNCKGWDAAPYPSVKI